MIIIGDNDVADNAALAAIPQATAAANPQAYNTAEACAYLYYPTFANGDVVPNDQVGGIGVWRKDEDMPCITLADAKKDLKKKVMLRTDELYNETGAVFDGHTFRVGENSKDAWIGIHLSKDFMNSQGMFPMNLRDKDGESYSLTYENVDNFYYTMLGGVSAIDATENPIMAAIDAATSAADLAAIVDDR